MLIKDLKLLIKDFCFSDISFDSESSLLFFKGSREEIFKLKIENISFETSFTIVKESFLILLDFYGGNFVFCQNQVEIVDKRKKIKLSFKPEIFKIDIKESSLVEEFQVNHLVDFENSLFLLPDNTLTFFQNYLYTTRVDFFSGRIKLPTELFKNLLELNPADLNILKYFLKFDSNLNFQHKQDYYQLSGKDFQIFLPKLNSKPVVEPLKNLFEKQDFLFSFDTEAPLNFFTLIKNSKTKESSELLFKLALEKFLISYKDEYLILEEDLTFLNLNNKQEINSVFKFSDAKLFSNILIKAKESINLKFFKNYALVSFNETQYLLSYAAS